MPEIKNLECSRCQATISAAMPQTLCPKCKGSLYVRYDLQPLHGIAARDAIAREAASCPWAGMWRYRSVLPMFGRLRSAKAGLPCLRASAIPTHS